MQSIEALIRAGVDPKLIQLVVDEMLALRTLRDHAEVTPSEPPLRSANAVRQARHRAKRASRGVTSNAGGMIAPSPKEKSPTPPKEITPSPSSLRSVRDRAREAFAEFWSSAYPKRDGSNPKQPAEQKFIRLVEAGEDPGAIIAGARSYAASVVHSEPRFTAQAVTWLKQGRWRDDYQPSQPRAGPRREPARNPYFQLLDRRADDIPDHHDGPTIDYADDPFPGGGERGHKAWGCDEPRLMELCERMQGDLDP